MAITYSGLKGVEPSTTSFDLGTVTVQRNSTNQLQELLCLADPETSNAIVRVTDGEPASTSFGLAVRTVGPVRSAATASTAAITAVAVSTVSSTLLAASTSRLGILMFNASTALCYVKFGPTAASTSYTRPMIPSEFWQVPLPTYQGLLTGIWTGADSTGAMRITELT